MDDENVNSTTEEPEIIDNPNDASLAKTLLKTPVSDVMEESFLRYSMSVIVARALPDVRDGLKPVQRRIIYSMEKSGYRSTSKTVKSANIVGEVMGKYHPHGDGAIYDAMARLAQPWSVRYLMINGQGNFGSMDGDPPAAYRYTEARLTKTSEDLIADIDKETVDFRDNYDGQRQEPEVLPARLPNLLMNGQLGIAVGMATNIPPHNVGELIDACALMIDTNFQAEVPEIMEHIKGPDFPTGGIIYGRESLQQAYATGRGSVPVRGVAEIVDGKKKGTSQIVITELPYAVNKASLVEKIGELHQDRKIQGITGLRDETARGKVRIVVDLKRDAYPKKVLNQLYKNTQLQTSFSYNMVALVDGIQPQVLGVRDILTEYLKHRQDVIKRRTEFELRKAKERAHILEGLKIALDNIDEVIKVIRASKSTDEAKTNLMKKFKLSDLQTTAILAMQLRALTGLERQKIEDELAELMKLIKKLEEILSSEKNILKVVKDELLEMREKYADERRTQVIPSELNGLSDEDLIPNEEVAVMLTESGYIKRTPIDAYRQQHRGGKGKKGIKTKEEDVVEHLRLANTHDFLLFFTNQGRVFRVKAYEVPQASLIAKGVAVVNILQLAPEESVTAMLNIDDMKAEQALVMCTLRGTVKMSNLEVFKNIRTSGIIAINLDDGDELKWVRTMSGDDDVMITTQMGSCIRFDRSNLRLMGRAARGVRGIKLRSDDRVVGMEVVSDGMKVLIVSENGYGKMTKVSNFTQHKRGGLGTKAASVTKKTGNLISVKVAPDDAVAVLMVSKNGQTIKIPVADVPNLGRVTQGVRLMRMNDDDSLTSVAILSQSPDDDEDDTKDQKSQSKDD